MVQKMEKYRKKTGEIIIQHKVCVAKKNSHQFSVKF